MKLATRPLVPFLLTAFTAAVLTACGGGGDDGATPIAQPEATRAQDTRTSFAVVPFDNTTAYPDYEAGAGGKASFTALAGTDTDRWTGTLGGAGYRVEVPRNWNGKLVMYAHGYRGTGDALTVSNPSVRKYLIDNGYAWAASSYSKNYYDVRAGVEDTNALANAFQQIARNNGRLLATPTKVYITGHSMGGHIAAAAVEAETIATANNVVRYAGAVPMCGVTGDMALFDTFTAMQVAAQAVAGVPNHPLTRWNEIAADVNAKLWLTAPGAGSPIVPTPVEGERFVSIVKNLTGGERPLFRLALQRGGSFPSAYGTFGGDGTVTGILNSWGTDTRAFTYTIDGDTVNTSAINAAAQKVSETPDANRLRRDGLRWVPQVNGEFSVPVVAIHTLGDLFVPFSMIQAYRQRAEAEGNGGRLVTRAIRGISHCDFTVSEQVEAVDAMLKWEGGGAKPTGDDVTTAATVAAPTYGCTHTRAAVGGTDTGTTVALRNLIGLAGGACPAP
ncbi:alpha/beta hydrolase [Ramlibacter pallidus]|uniref:Alpha/beta hydrolase n=1 Tax=Ramlibacter pallidus TaxID=2780087 RepID=A0ABR9S4Z9_9BURK|nr:alpha/beta hydrolase [Ramlibacter pallidus]MBE7368377.1 alpha/beta hydrolase [Ramlibacter pallidus]